MLKLTFEFETPQEAVVVLKAQEMASALYDFDTYLRNMLKYHLDEASPEIVAKVEEIRKELAELMNDAGIIEVVFNT